MNNTNFYPFGVDVGDAQLQTADDGSSPPIYLSTPFRFFETPESILYVSQLCMFFLSNTQALSWWPQLLLHTLSVSLHRSPQMGFFHSDLHLLHFSLESFHSSAHHWLLLSGMMWTSHSLATFSTDRHLILPFSKEPEINYTSYFHSLPTLLQAHCSLPHGIGWQSFLERDHRYQHKTVCLLATVTNVCYSASSYQ